MNMPAAPLKKHELTRREKELDRIEHFDACSAQTEPVFLAYRKHEGLSAIIREWIKFTNPNMILPRRTASPISCGPFPSPARWKTSAKSFEEVDALYIADGHHRTASSAAVSARRRQKHPDYTGQEEFNYLMAVVFCDEDLFIMDYNRVIRDLNGLTEEEFMEKLRTSFDINPVDTIPGEGYAPRAKHEFGMYLNGRWYSATAKPGTFPAGHPIESLDCAILQANVLAPILGIDDPRTSDRIDFVGGIRGLGELERRCSGEMALAFSLYPVTMADLFRVADAGEIMPPQIHLVLNPSCAAGFLSIPLNNNLFHRTNMNKVLILPNSPT